MRLVNVLDMKLVGDLQLFAVNYHNRGAPTAYNHLAVIISSFDTLTVSF